MFYCNCSPFTSLYRFQVSNLSCIHCIVTAILSFNCAFIVLIVEYSLYHDSTFSQLSYRASATTPVSIWGQSNIILSFTMFIVLAICLHHSTVFDCYSTINLSCINGIVTERLSFHCAFIASWLVSIYHCMMHLLYHNCSFSLSFYRGCNLSLSLHCAFIVR
jgi:hypothetical protein